MDSKVPFGSLKKREGELDKCTNCGYCAFWCPIYQEDPRERSGTRGKLAILKDLLTGKVDYNQEAAEVIERCLLC